MISNKYPKKKKKRSILITPLSNEEKSLCRNGIELICLHKMFKIEGKQGAWAAQPMNNSRKFIFESNWRQIILCSICKSAISLFNILNVILSE